MKYYLSKLGYFLLTVWAAITLNFLIPRLQPGDPAEIMVRKLQSQNGDAPLDPAQVQAIRAMLGTPDGSLWSQYWTYLGELVQGNLGISFTYFPFPVTEVMAKALPWSIMLIGITQVLAFVVGHPARGVRGLAPQHPRSTPWCPSARPSSATCSRSGSVC